MSRIIISTILTIVLSISGYFDPLLELSDLNLNSQKQPIRTDVVYYYGSSLLDYNALKSLNEPNPKTPSSEPSAQIIKTQTEILRVNVIDVHSEEAYIKPTILLSETRIPASKIPAQPPETSLIAAGPQNISRSSDNTRANLSNATAVTSTFTATPANDRRIFDFSQTSIGIVNVRYMNNSGRRVRLLIEKAGVRYTYEVRGDNSIETFPLQSGDGEYSVTLLENTVGNRYRVLLNERTQVTLNDQNSVFLASIPMVNWNREMDAIRLATELTAGLNNDEAKVSAVYNFVIRNISYDSNKLKSLPSTYLPNINDTLRLRSGICYDFASIFAGMLRSLGIPTKLVKGYADGVLEYHAWNEVYINGNWRIIDTSVDSQLFRRGSRFNMFKNSGSYSKQREF